jgi:small-conductance mechanosensitive channel
VEEDLEEQAGGLDIAFSNLSLALNRIVALRKQLEGSDATGDAEVIRSRLEAQQRLEASHQRVIETLTGTRRLLGHLQSEIENRRDTASLLERAGGLIERNWSRIKGIWHFELMAVGDKGITVSKVLLALVFLVVGIIAAKWISHAWTRLTGKRFGLDQSLQATIEKLAFYVLLVIVVVSALTIVEIPLTIFAFLGGAIAIGVGFGARNLINNFISGLILLLERPVKVGDLVEVDGVRGRILNIGARCSRIWLFNGVDMLVPNSLLLEQKVTNLTLSDKMLRFELRVGVTYDSDPHRTAEIVERCAREHEKIRENPDPLVIFEEFGDNALIFALYVWMEINTLMDYRVVMSKLRFDIFDALSEAGIVIAFPQRDVHLDSASPLRVEMVRPARGADGSGGDDG